MPFIVLHLVNAGIDDNGFVRQCVMLESTEAGLSEVMREKSERPRVEMARRSTRASTEDVSNKN